jgi:hypothetical protein
MDFLVSLGLSLFRKISEMPKRKMLPHNSVKSLRPKTWFMQHNLQPSQVLGKSPSIGAQAPRRPEVFSLQTSTFIDDAVESFDWPLTGDAVVLKLKII